MADQMMRGRFHVNLWKEVLGVGEWFVPSLAISPSRVYTQLPVCETDPTWQMLAKVYQWFEGNNPVGVEGIEDSIMALPSGLFV